MLKNQEIAHKLLKEKNSNSNSQNTQNQNLSVSNISKKQGKDTGNRCCDHQHIPKNKLDVITKEDEVEFEKLKSTVSKLFYYLILNRVKKNLNT